MVLGTNQQFSWDYSEKSDILNIHKNGTRTAGSAELGDFTIDFDKDGNVSGVEVMNAAEFFLSVSITKESLKQMEGAELVIKKKDDYTIILMKLILQHKKEIIIPIPAPVVAE